MITILQKENYSHISHVSYFRCHFENFYLEFYFFFKSVISKNADTVTRTYISEPIAIILKHNRREEICRRVNAQLMKSTGRVKTTTVHIDMVVSLVLWRLFELFNAHVGLVDNAMGGLSLFPRHIVRQIVALGFVSEEGFLYF